MGVGLRLMGGDVGKCRWVLVWGGGCGEVDGGGGDFLNFLSFLKL